MTGKNDDEATKETIKKIVEEGKWPLFVGSSTDKREDCAQYTHKKSMILKGYGETEKGCGEIEIIDLSGQTGKEILKSVLGQNLESNLNKLKNELWEYMETNEEAEWKLLEAGTGALRVSQDDNARIEAIRRVQELVKESPILNLYCLFKTLFINNLQCKNEQDVNAIKKITAFIRHNIKDFQGMLVVGITTLGDCELLPTDFKDLFELVELETKKEKEMKITNENITQFTHSDDYSSVCIRGKHYALTENQANVIKILHENHEKGNPNLRQTYILKQTDIWSINLARAFQRNNKAFKDLIVADGPKGTVRLNINQ